jgi:hypothetical protein
VPLQYINAYISDTPQQQQQQQGGGNSAATHLSGRRKLLLLQKLPTGSTAMPRHSFIAKPVGQQQQQQQQQQQRGLLQAPVAADSATTTYAAYTILSSQPDVYVGRLQAALAGDGAAFYSR